jgi:L-lactate dehydrogenase complex protein LldG
MSAKEAILVNIIANQPVGNPLPVIDVNAMIQYDDLVAQFKFVLESIGGRLIQVEDNEAAHEMILTLSKDKETIVNALEPTDALVRQLTSMSLESLAMVDLAIIKGSCGVAETGAVWVDEKQMVIRILPFICEQLVFVLDRTGLVTNMGEAYQRINTFETGFGVFIAGPSKTADIEQSLVIGAHGPKQSVVILVG